MSINRAELEAEILAQAKASDELKNGLEQFAIQVRDYWRSISPVRTGRYAASVQVYKKPITVDGMPGRQVGSRSNRAHLIEYGTGFDKNVKAQKGAPEGSHYVKALDAMVSNNTPTPTWAPRAKTAAHFGGDESRVDAILGDESLSYEQRKAALKQFDTIIMPPGGNQ